MTCVNRSARFDFYPVNISQSLIKTIFFNYYYYFIENKTEEN